jgi:hypothetical protein
MALMARSPSTTKVSRSAASGLVGNDLHQGGRQWPISVAARPPMDQMELEDSEVPVSELYHSSETREHEFAEELVAISDLKEGYNLSLNGTLLRKQKLQEMQRRMEESWCSTANPSMITDWRG